MGGGWLAGQAAGQAGPGESRRAQNATRRRHAGDKLALSLYLLCRRVLFLLPAQGSRLPVHAPPSSLVRVAEDAIHLLQRLELVDRAGVARVLVRVQRQRQLMEGLADVRLLEG